MSAKNALPDSLELLLDTMCNTFGGVMFITLSMALMLFLCRSVEQSKAIVSEKEIEQIRQETAEINQRIQAMQQKIESMDADSALYDETKQNLIENQKMEMELKQLRYKELTLKQSCQEMQRQTDRLKIQIKKRTQDIAQMEKRSKSFYVQSTGENGNLKAEIALLEENLRETKEKQVNFSRNTGTTLTPYWIIFENDTLYGTLEPKADNKQITVQKNGDTIRLIPGKDGVQVREQSASQATRVFMQAYSPKKYFASFWVHPSSFQAFVAVRRELRALGYKVDWLCTSNYVLIMGGSGHQASD